ncbi:hypothetical protein GCM10010299_13950 [Streptomyces tanashiensis]|nr:hypothetical protein GCM10010299_13950 [Streptomyces tanashiensis]
MRRYRAVEAFLQAARDGEFEALLAMPDPDATYRPDEAARLLGAGTDLDSGRVLAEAFCGNAQTARAIMLDGEPGMVLAPHGELMLVMPSDSPARVSPRSTRSERTTGCRGWNSRCHSPRAQAWDTTLRRPPSRRTGGCGPVLFLT